MKIFVTLLTILSAIVLVFSNRVSAETIDVSGNGAGSSNSVNVNQSNSTNTTQNNNANISNNVNANCNTGNNSSSGNTGGNTSTATGNCSANVNISNNVNSNNAKVVCCASPTPKVTPGLGGQGGPDGGGESISGGGESSSGGGSPQILGSTGVAESTIVSILGFTLLAAGLTFANRSFARR